MQKSGVVLLRSDAMGIYIPKNFSEDFDQIRWHVEPEDTVILADPENEYYWDAWCDVLDYAYYIDDDGNEYRLHLDGDLWAVCKELLTDDEKRNFGFDY